MRAGKPREPYPPEWRGTWFRPGVPGGVPSALAKRYAWAEIIRAVDGPEWPAPDAEAVEAWRDPDAVFAG